MLDKNIKEKATKGLFWGGVSNSMQQGFSIIVGIILLKELTPADYGMIGMLAIFSSIANTLLESGFTAALTNRQKYDNNDYNSVFWFNIFMAFLFYGILYFLAPLIASFYNHPKLIILSRILFLNILISSLGIAHNAVLFKNLMVKERAKIDIISSFFSGRVGIDRMIVVLG